MSIEAVKEKNEERLMRLPNVTGVGIGEKAGKGVAFVPTALALISRRTVQSYTHVHARLTRVRGETCRP